MSIINTDWTPTNPPPEGHPDVGQWAYGLFSMANEEKERLGLPDRWYENYRLFRGDHWAKARRPWTLSQDRDKLSINLFFANVMRTVANLTGRNPTVEIHALDEAGMGEIETLMNTEIERWWNVTEQAGVLSGSAQVMEVYGTTIEKHVLDADTLDSGTVLVDPFAWFPAPGIYVDIQDMPYMAHAYPMPCDAAERTFGVLGVVPDDTYSLLGEDREDTRPIPDSRRLGGLEVQGQYAMKPSRDYRLARALVIELWVRDMTRETYLEESEASRSGGVSLEEATRAKYPGGIRKITITNRGSLVLDDCPNPNVNPALPQELTENTYGWSNFPFTIANSYTDSTSIWGFSAGEQVGDLQLKIDEIVSNISSYIRKCLKPPFVVPKDTGINVDSITNVAGLILQPKTTQAGSGIRFVQVPSLPPDFYRTVDLYMGFFDRVYAIQDVDRGQTPTNIQAASAIITLQERNAVLMRHKIRATDYLVRERGRWAISHLQNFAWRERVLKVDDEVKMFRGTDYAGMQFDFVVESGSTVTKTNLQVMEDAKELYKMSVIDRQALLEALHFPGWKAILERTAEGQLDQALQVLVQAGLPVEVGMQLKQELALTQGGPGNMPPAGGAGTAPQVPMPTGAGQAPMTVPGTGQPAPVPMETASPGVSTVQ